MSHSLTELELQTLQLVDELTKAGRERLADFLQDKQIRWWETEEIFRTFDALEERGYVEYIVEDIHNGVRGGFSKVRLTNTGLNTIADLPEKIDTPETDVFIPIDRDSPAFLDADRALEELSKNVLASNELRVSKEDRLSVLSEISGLRSLLSGHSVRRAAIWSATHGSGVLVWLARQTASATVAELAKEAVKCLLKLIGLG